ncbi:hypothetical protein O9993_20405 [Vibrio lentus]|nr:hypothetical protein [Vibrio lentus]
MAAGADVEIVPHLPVSNFQVRLALRSNEQTCAGLDGEAIEGLDDDPTTRSIRREPQAIDMVRTICLKV